MRQTITAHFYEMAAVKRKKTNTNKTSSQSLTAAALYLNQGASPLNRRHFSDRDQ